MPRSLPVLNGSSALRADGRRTFVVPADVKGRFVTRRRLVFALLLVVYVALPFLELNGRPVLFLDIAHRAFHLFGATFNAQDFWLAFFLFSGVGFSLIVATALWGRVWCGYACPQTVFLEGVFRRIERWVEGPKAVRERRDQAGFSAPRTARKVLKHALFILFSFAVAHLFLSYFTSLTSLLAMIAEGPRRHPEAFAWAAGSTAVMYFNFAWFREQLCIIICPYGRLQSVLTDPDTLVIGYDTRRGEPRGKAKQADRGACVDCGRCVAVCPTGIDIRNGLQLECVGCAGCVDACDEVMDRLERPRGLIRYDSQRGLAGEPRRFWRARVGLYAALGALGLLVASFAFRQREPFEANLLRMSGAPFTLEDKGTRVRNTLEIHLVNKRGEPARFTVAPSDAQLDYLLSREELTLAPLGSARVALVVTGPNDGRPRQVSLRVTQGTDERVVTGPFVAPR